VIYFLACPGVLPTTTQQTSHRPEILSKFVGRQPGKSGWRQVIAWRAALPEG